MTSINAVLGNFSIESIRNKTIRIAYTIHINQKIIYWQYFCNKGGEIFTVSNGIRFLPFLVLDFLGIAEVKQCETIWQKFKSYGCPSNRQNKVPIKNHNNQNNYPHHSMKEAITKCTA